MTSRGEKLFYVLSLVCVFTGLAGAGTYVFYLSIGGKLQDGTVMPMSTMVLGLLAYFILRAVPGFIGWRGCKKHNVRYVQCAFIIMIFALVMSLGVQKIIPGVGTGILVPGIYLILCFRYMRALTAEQKAQDTKWMQKPGDGPRLG